MNIGYNLLELLVPTINLYGILIIAFFLMKMSKTNNNKFLLEKNQFIQKVVDNLISPEKQTT